MYTGISYIKGSFCKVRFINGKIHFNGFFFVVSLRSSLVLLMKHFCWIINQPCLKYTLMHPLISGVTGNKQAEFELTVWQNVQNTTHGLIFDLKSRAKLSEKALKCCSFGEIASFQNPGELHNTPQPQLMLS